MPNKKNFRSNDYVELFNTGDARLDGLTGTIVGLAQIDVDDIYIVWMNEPFPTEFPLRPDFGPIRAITLTEHCLKYRKF